MTAFGDAVIESGDFARAGGGQLKLPEILATRGDYIALGRTVLSAESMEVPFLSILRVEPDGRAAEYVMFEPEAVNDAIAALDEMAAANAFENAAARAARRYEAAFNAGDLDTAIAYYADGYTIEERRSLVRMSLDREQSIATARLITDGGGQLETDFLATRGERLFLARVVLRLPAPDATATVLCVSSFDCAGRYERTVTFDPDDLDAAFTELDQMFVGGEGGDHATLLALGAEFLEALSRFDAGALRPMFAPQFTACDHRSVVGVPSLDADEWLAQLRAASGLYGQSVMRVDHISDVSSTGGLWVTTGTGELVNGGKYEVRLMMALRVDGDQLVALDIFDERDVDDARAVLKTPPDYPKARFDNDATRTTARVHHAFNADDWDAVQDCYADVYTMDDRRQLTGLPLTREHAIATLRLMFEGTGSYEERESIATRGNSLALQRTTFQVSDPEATVVVLAITEVDGAGRFRRSVIFDPDDLDAAFSELDRMFLAGEGADHGEALALGASVLEALARLDTAALRRLFAPHFSARDHRAVVGVPSLDGDEWLAEFNAASELYGPSTARVDHITDLSTTGGLWALSSTGTLSDGGQWDLKLLLALRVAGRQVVALDIFDEHDVDDARAVLKTAPTEKREYFENDATRSLARFHAAHSARDWDALVDVLADDFTQDDRRSLVRVSSAHDEAVASVHLIFDGNAVLEYEVLATRGRSLCLTRDTLSLTDPEIRFTVLSICVVDGTGRQQRVIMFDADDLGTALAELDRMFLDGEGNRDCVENDASRNLARVVTAQNTRNWSELQDCYSATYTMDEQRSLVRASMDHDESIAGVRHIFDGRGVLDYELLATRGRSLCLSRDTIWIPEFTAAGASLTVNRVDESGRLERTVAFDADDFDGALAELDRQHREESRGEHPAWRAAQRLTDAHNRRNLGGIRDAVDPRCLFVDRRHGTQLRLEGADAVIASYAVGTALDDVSEECTLIATRGNSLALTRVLVKFTDRHAGPAEVEVIALVECGADGRILSNTAFEPDALQAAYAALESRHAELNEAIGNTAWRAAQKLSGALNRRDWHGVLQLLDQDRYTDVDHRARLRLEGDDALRPLRFAISLDELRDQCILVAARGDHLALIRHLVMFIDGVAGPSEVEVLALVESGTDGRIVSSTAFDISDLESAYAALDARHAQLGLVHGASRGLEWFENDAWLTSLRIRDAAYRRDLQAIRDANASGVVAIDHRHGALRWEGEEWLDASRVMLAVDEFEWEAKLIATRGDRLALMRHTVRVLDGDAGPSEVATLTIVQVDEQGLQVAAEMFEPDDLDAAFDVLDDRWVALGGPAFAPVLKRSVDARDWDAFASLFAADCTLVDHRTTSWGTVDKTTIVEYHRSIAELSGDVHFWVDHVRNRGNVYVSAAHVFGDESGGAWEIAFITVGVVQPDGRGKHIESYEIRDFPLALQRFDELVADTAS
jgi:hypothetical protein